MGNDSHKSWKTILMKSCRRWESLLAVSYKNTIMIGAFIVVFVECKRVNDARSFPSINRSVQYSTKENQLNCKFWELLLLCDVSDCHFVLAIFFPRIENSTYVILKHFLLFIFS